MNKDIKISKIAKIQGSNYTINQEQIRATAWIESDFYLDITARIVCPKSGFLYKMTTQDKTEFSIKATPMQKCKLGFKIPLLSIFGRKPAKSLKLIIRILVYDRPIKNDTHIIDLIELEYSIEIVNSRSMVKINQEKMREDGMHPYEKRMIMKSYYNEFYEPYLDNCHQQK